MNKENDPIYTGQNLRSTTIWASREQRVNPYLDRTQTQIYNNNGTEATYNSVYITTKAPVETNDLLLYNKDHELIKIQDKF